MDHNCHFLTISQAAELCHRQEVPIPSLPAEAEVVVAGGVLTEPWGSPLPEGLQSQGLSDASPGTLILLILREQVGYGKAVPGHHQRCLHHTHCCRSPRALVPNCTPENPGVNKQLR